MRFAILGPLEVSASAGPIALGGPKQRTLLALLLLQANTVVSRDRLIDVLWGDCPPPSAAESLDAYLSRLRKLVGHDRLLRRAGGYVLRIAPGELDADQFERLVASGRRAADVGDAATAARELADALSLWRGRPLAEFAYQPFAEGEIARLEEARVAAIEDRIDAELRTGRGAELAPELERLVAEHPLRERLLAGLMLALYRAGRQTDALDTFKVARRRLVEELGLEPGPGLRELQRRILQQDPALGAPPPLLQASGLRGRRRLAVAILLALVVAGGVFLLDAGAGGRQPALAAGASGVVGIDTGSGRVAIAAPLTGAPAGVCTDAGSVWVADASDGTVSRINPTTGAPIDRIPVGGSPASIACGDGAVWAANTDGAAVLRIDPTAEAVTQTIPLGGGHPDALAFGAGRLWVADSSIRALYILDPSAIDPRRVLVGRIPLSLTPSAVVFGAGALWVAGYDSGTVVEVNPSSGRAMGLVRVGTGPDALAFAAGDLWVANSLASTVSRIDPASLKVTATIPVGSGPSAVVADGGWVWVANQYSASVSRIDPRRDAVEATADVGGMPTALIADGAKVWVGVAASGHSHHGGTLVIASDSPFDTLDPAFFSGTEPPQSEGLAYDTLVTFDHTGGVDGLRLVPDLALTLPTPTDDGRTYTFQLRSGIRYSNGTTLRASDFRRAIERLFRAGSPGSGDYTSIVGATTCIRRPAGCDLSHGIITNDAAGTLVFHLTAPDPAFLYQLTEENGVPIPPGTPDYDTMLNPIPGTGPYRIARADRAGVRFVRNAYFQEWSHAAQPDGNPSEIVWRYLPTQQDAAAAVREGHADWLDGAIPLPEYRQIELQSPAQLHSHPLFAVEFLPVNTRLAPFNNILVRKALNYAIDRDVVVRMYGGPAFATPTCQPLAPGLPGYVRYCPYTTHPRADGAYSGPDLSYARRLVARSGTRGEHVTVWGSPDEGYVPPNMPNYVASLLQSLGYQATVRLRPIGSITAAMYARFQLSTNGDWLADYPDPSSYIPQFFSCRGGDSNGYVCNPALDRDMRRAELLEHRAPTAATALWTTIDHNITNQADWVPTVSSREVDLVSKRLGGYQFNPFWGFLVDQSWVR